MASTLDGMASVTNLQALDIAIQSADDKKPLEEAHNKLVALLGAKIKATEALIKLQSAYCDSVEPGDSAAINDLGNFNKKLERYVASYIGHEAHSSEAAELLGTHLGEVTKDLDSTSKVFAEYAAVTAERTAIFSNFSGK